jgi:hypothetical protein
MNVNDRTTYIGSSDARDILAGSFDRLYKLKTGAIEPDDLSDNFPVQLGLHTEGFHLDWTIRRLVEEKGDGFNWSQFAENGDQHHASFTPEQAEYRPPLVSHPDALLRDPSGAVLPLEAKHTGRFKNADEAADFYMPQLQHHLLCWNSKVLLFSVICGNSEPERIWVGFSQEWADHYIEQCNRFWSYVATKTPPAPAFYDDAKEPSIPTAVKNTVPINGMLKRDMTGNNRFKAVTSEFIETKAAVAKHEKAKKDLKSMMNDDDKEIFSDEIKLKRDARGAIRITVLEKEDA